MPRRQPRLTRPKRVGKNQKPRTLGGDPSAPTPQEWDTMNEFGAFVGKYYYV
jgi:hypothetical protein